MKTRNREFKKAVKGSLCSPSIPKVPCKLSLSDRFNNFLVRASFNRHDYAVDPGLYALGEPTADSPVMVSANYKLTFDLLRQALVGLSAWILVLDTNGVNVWCAAGKGTFGTKELVNRVKLTKLSEFVSHRRLIVPQLGATGISAHEVRAESGFNVVYGPVRAEDLITFLSAGLKATPKMREVTFSLPDRLVLVPVEVVQGFRYFAFASIFLFLLGGINPVVNLLAAYFAGAVLGPVLLPWLPGRAFSIKGFFAGLIMLAVVVAAGTVEASLVELLAWGLLITSLSSFLTMNFTGASTYTSPSGVLKEMKLAMPLQIVAAIVGALLWLVVRFF